MKNILVPLDGSASSLRALQAALDMSKQQSSPATLHVLNVQPPIISNNVARFFSPEVLKDYYQEEGQAIIEKAKAVLDKETVPHQYYIEVGHVTDIVQRYVDDLSLDHIVMGTRGLSAVPGLLLGSVTTKIIHSVTIPVTLIK